MNLLFRVIHASRCSSSHHKLAVDALRHLPGSAAESWRNLFLKHIEEYLEGAKAPDKKFRDFRNHVLHVQDNHWGGAPKAARKWYDLTVKGLRRRNWVQAIYSAGVLSHYYVDPIQPLHTAQSEQENNIHRAFEWSVAKSYDDIFQLLKQQRGLPQVDVPAGDDWLEQMVIQGAEVANPHYDTLVANYNFDRGVKQPEAGLDSTCRTILCELIGYAQVGLAQILQRAFTEARVTPPETLVTLRGILAALQIPIRWVTRKIADEHERTTIEAMYRELKSTGKVERMLPADDRAVRDLHAKEMRAQQQRKDGPVGTSRACDAGPSPRSLGSTDSATGPGRASRDSTGISPDSGRSDMEVKPKSMDASRHDGSTRSFREGSESRQSKKPGFSLTGGGPDDLTSREEREASATRLPKPASRDTLPHRPYLKYPQADTSRDSAPTDRRGSESSRDDQPEPSLRFYLERSSNVVDAPSIGPKTARRLRKVQVRTVGDLLRLDPERASAKIGARHITPQVIRDWQDQARLVCRIPQLRGHDAQLLVGCGYTEPDQVARAQDRDLFARVKSFSGTTEGKRILRTSSPPDLEEVRDWIRWAQSSRRLEAA